ncbi:MAG: hypothetical protein ACRCXT_08850 [Paraclostridium sp.]
MSKIIVQGTFNIYDECAYVEYSYFDYSKKKKGIVERKMGVKI